MLQSFLIIMAWSKVEAVVVSLSFLLTSVQSRGHHHIVQNLMSFGESELAIFIDNPTDLSYFVDPGQIQFPLKVFPSNQQIQQKPNCPSDNDMDFHYEPSYLNSANRHYTFVVNAKEVSKVLAIFDNTVLNCSYLFEPGIYNIDNRFLFILDNNDNMAKKSEDIFNGSPHIPNHRFDSHT